MSRLKLAVIGSRGIPASYSGFETLAEELATRLQTNGFRVTVYCRSHHVPADLKEHDGVELVVLPTIRSKHLDTPVHTFLSCLHAFRRSYDVALVVNAANAVFVPLLRLAGVKVVLHVDGLDRERAKWGPFGRAVYAISERLAARVPQVVVTDAERVKTYFKERHGLDSRLIAYGVEPQPLPPGETLQRLGLEPGRYVLYVSRFEPENNPHRVAEAYRGVGGEMPLVMVGWAPYAGRFTRSFVDGADSRISFPGAIYGEGYRELLSNAYAYIQATEVGGAHPALIEAMGYGNCPVVNETDENREVAGPEALYFEAGRPETLTRALNQILQSPEEAARRAAAAAERARELFSWTEVSRQYAELFKSL